MSKPKSGTFLEWHSIQGYTKHLHDISVGHLINIWPSLCNRIGDSSLWGDELEYQIIGLDPERQEPYLSMKQPLLLERLAESPHETDWQSEYTRYMVECAPEEPYNGYHDVSKLEQKLINRRKAIKSHLEANEAAYSISAFPLLQISTLSKALGVPPEDGESILQKAVAPVGRYTVLRKNVLSRSRRNFYAEVPIFLDSRTLQILEAGLRTDKNIVTGVDNHPNIVLEDILFAMGGCGLQATFQAKDLSEVRKLHDQLSILGPILLSLTAATPIYKGMLVNTDTRWSQACKMVDDRTPEELKELTPRWSTSPMYLSVETQSRPELSASNLKRDEEIEARLKDNGLDPIMATYFAHLHLRDPLVLNGDDSSILTMSGEAVHESLCSSVWTHVRLKIPQAGNPGSLEEETEGWRIEFRPMEVQLTDFANAAFLIFTRLLRDVLSSYDLDLYMPLSKVRENMDRAHVRNSVLEERFWFPTNPYPGQRKQDDLVLMSIDEIINGMKGDPGVIKADSSPAKFKGLIPLIKEHVEPDIYQGISKYLAFIAGRASGSEPTPAAWQRSFVENHAEYSQDSIVVQRIAYDMLNEIRVMN